MARTTRPLRVEGRLVFITLTKGYEAVIDDSDVPLVDGINWCAIVDPRRKAVYAMRRVNGRTVYLHRVLMGEPQDHEVDHRDGDGLNCRRSNLRVATISQNRQNARIPKTNTSGFKGVTFHKQRGKWQAQIRFGGRKRHLGLHDTPEAAHDAYCRASAELHGEFGRVE